MAIDHADRTFEQQITEASVSATRLGSVLAAITIPAGILLDQVTHPEKVTEFLWIRLTSAALCLLVLPLTYAPALIRRPGLPSAALSLICQGNILAMIARLEGHASPYYAGLNATILAFCLLYNWHWRYTAFFCSSTVILWLALSAHDAQTTVFDDKAFGNNLYFLMLTSGLAIATSAARFRLARKEFDARSGLASASSELVGTLDRLRQHDRFKSEFFANITHELKTPLTTILAPLELMIDGEMGKLTDAQRASLRSMLRSGVNLRRLIADLLDLSRLDESRLQLQIAEHDLVEYLRGLLNQIHSLAQRKAIALTLESNVEQCFVYCDPERLERVFVNLLSNAAKFTPAHGSIRLVLEDDESSVRISVIDDGIGFPPDMADRIFERFFQVDMAATRKVGGTGIGLALARELVTLHGGKISAQSEPERGATFTVELLKGKSHIDPSHIDRRGTSSHTADRYLRSGCLAFSNGYRRGALSRRRSFTALPDTSFYAASSDSSLLRGLSEAAR